MANHVPTEQDKQNMQMGAKAMRAIDAYLVFISQDKPRGRRVDRAALEEKIKAEPNLAKKVILIAQMHEALKREDAYLVEAELEQEFVKYAPWFSEQHNITTLAWKEMGVQQKVLSKAGITS